MISEYMKNLMQNYIVDYFFSFIVRTSSLKVSIFNFSCCETPNPAPGQKDACCHMEGFSKKPPEWRCNKDLGSGEMNYQLTHIQEKNLATIIRVKLEFQII